MEKSVCILLCDDETSILKMLSRVCKSALPQNLMHHLEQAGQARLAAEQSAANPSMPLVAMSDHPLLIIELARLLSVLTSTTSFGLITDGNLLAEGEIRTGDDLVVVLRGILGPRLKMAVMYTGNPGQFADLAQKHGYALLAKPASFAEVKTLLMDFVQAG